VNPHAIFEIDGFAWDSWEHPRLFQRVTADLGTGEASMATWQLLDPNFIIIDKYAGVAAGTAKLPVIRVFVGFGEKLGEPVFKGLLARVERGDSSTTFRAYDMSYKMRLTKKARYLKGSDLGIIEKLAKEDGLKFQGPEKPLRLEPHKAMAQDEQTNWEHASQVAHDAGLLLWCREDTLRGDYPAKVKEPKLTLTYKKDFSILRQFDGQFKVPENREGRPRGVEVRGRARGGKRLKGNSAVSQRGHDLLHIKKDLAIHSKERATARAQAQRELDREHAFEFRISLLPSAADARIDVRDTVRLQEVGKLFSGDYIVNQVGYEFGPGKLMRTLELYRDVKE
jgi:hypothetical protein